MKITYLFQYFATPDMAGGTRAYEFARRLVANGHEVSMITTFRGETKRREWFETEESGINVHWYPVAYSNYLSFRQRMAAFIRFAMASKKKAASLDADVVFATSTPLTIAIPGVYASRRRKIPLVFEVRDLWPEMPIAMGALRNRFLIQSARALEKYAYRNASRIVALSPGMAEGVRSTGVPNEKIHVIPNSCDIESFRLGQKQIDEFRREYFEIGDGPIVLYAGTLGKLNGVNYLAHLAKCLEDVGSSARVVVFGDGACAAGLSELSKNLGVLNKNFFQYPRISKRMIAQAFAAATIVTSIVCDIPEAEKNSANKFFDGLAAGRPVAINYGGWQAELIHETGCGIVLSRKPEQAAEQIHRFISDPVKVNHASLASIQLARERFARDKLANDLEDVLHQAIGD